MSSSNLLLPKDDPFNALANYFKGTELFVFRLEREGRLVAFREAVKDEVRKGCTYATAEKRVRPKFGFLEVKEERRLYVEELKLRDAQKKAGSSTVRAQAHRQNKKITSVELELMQLPNSSDPAKEMAWVRSHPAMGRASVVKGKPAAITVLKPEDVLQAPHGPCPSRTAWNMLAHWIDNPNEFHKMLLSEAKKAVQDSRKAAEEDAEENDDPTEQDIEDLLDALTAPEAEGAES